MNKYDFIKNIIEDNILIRIPVHDFDGKEIGYLKPITRKMIENDHIIVTKLTEWRNQASRNFFSTFTATEERTKNWLFNQVLNKSDKLLFLIYSNSGLAGHLGFANFKDKFLELDNLIRGEREGHPGLILFSELSLIDWIFKELEVTEITGQVLSINLTAMLLHKKVGFEICGKIYLKEIVDGDGTKLVDITGNDFKDEKLFKYMTSINREKFYQIYNKNKYNIGNAEVFK